MADAPPNLDTLLRQLRFYAEHRQQGPEAFILKYGREWAATPRPRGVHKQRAKQCYANSQKHLLATAWRSDAAVLTYVEGWAIHALTGGFAMLHGWLVDRDGRVLDLTWKQPQGSIYFGVPFRDEYVRRQVRDRMLWGSLIDCPATRWALLAGEVPLEEALEPLSAWATPQDLDKATV
jgi:hypothetical protein